MHWHLGDGNLDNTKGITLCTDSFSKSDVNFLTKGLRELGITSRVTQKRRIVIPNCCVWEFLKYVGDCPVQSMGYKWDSIVTQSYQNRSCVGCSKKFNATTNHKVHCSDKCYKRLWKRMARDHAG